MRIAIDPNDKTTGEYTRERRNGETAENEELNIRPPANHKKSKKHKKITGIEKAKYYQAMAKNNKDNVTKTK